MNILSFYGAKHGVGTTTIATMMFVQNQDLRLLISHDVEDTLSLLGMPGWDTNTQLSHDISRDLYVPSGNSVLLFDPTRRVRESHLRTARFSAGAELIIMDWGVTPPTIGTPIMVTDNSYLALRRAVGKIRGQEVVLVRDSTRALTSRDVEHALGAHVTVLDRDSSLMRACDAGLLTMRLPSHLTNALRSLHQEVPTC